jgi:MFS family permease
VNSLRREFSLLGLFIIGVGTGGIKPCVSAFGGEQFVRPQQDKQLEQFFSYFYISINAGSLLSTLLTPILREDIQCFGQSSCFPLAFGVPAILMIVAIGTLHQIPSILHARQNNLSLVFLRFLNALSLRPNKSCFLFRQVELQDAPYGRKYHGRRIKMHCRNNSYLK